jgi:hypothetical protein
MPFNTQVEMFDGPLLQYAVEMTHELDAKFGQKPKRTMSQVRSRPKPGSWAKATTPPSL